MKEWGASCAVRPEKLSSKIVPTEGEASTSQIKSTPDGSTKARKGLTYSDGASGSASGGASVSPLQSFILHQKHMIEDQEGTVYKIEKDRDNFVRDRTPVAAPGLGIWGAFEGQHAFWRGQDRIHEISPPPRCQNF